MSKPECSEIKRTSAPYVHAAARVVRSRSDHLQARDDGVGGGDGGDDVPGHALRLVAAQQVDLIVTRRR